MRKADNKDSETKLKATNDDRVDYHPNISRYLKRTRPFHARLAYITTMLKVLVSLNALGYISMAHSGVIRLAFFIICPIG